MLPEERTLIIQHLVVEALLRRTAHEGPLLGLLATDHAQKVHHALAEAVEVIAEDAVTASHKVRTSTQLSS